jgi:hypothetical protein
MAMLTAPDETDALRERPVRVRSRRRSDSAQSPAQ